MSVAGGEAEVLDVVEDADLVPDVGVRGEQVAGDAGLEAVADDLTGLGGLELLGETQGVYICVGVLQLARRKFIPAAAPLSAAYRAAWPNRLWPDEESSDCTDMRVSAPRPSSALTAMRVRVSAAPFSP